MQNITKVIVYSAQLMCIRKEQQIKYFNNQYTQAMEENLKGDESKLVNISYAIPEGDVAKRREIEEKSEKRNESILFKDKSKKREDYYGER